MARQTSDPISSPSLFPFLSILTCTSGVLAFIILSIGFLSVASPSITVKARALGEEDRKQAIYVECHADHVIIHPERLRAPLDSLAAEGARYRQFLERVADRAASEYVVFAVYPQGEKTFREARQAVDDLNEKNKFWPGRQIDVGYEPLNRGWRLKIKTNEVKDAAASTER